MARARHAPVVLHDLQVGQPVSRRLHGLRDGLLLDIGVEGVQHHAEIEASHGVDQHGGLHRPDAEAAFVAVQRLEHEGYPAVGGVWEDLSQSRSGAVDVGLELVRGARLHDARPLSDFSRYERRPEGFGHIDTVPEMVDASGPDRGVVVSQARLGLYLGQHHRLEAVALELRGHCLYVERVAVPDGDLQYVVPQGTHVADYPRVLVSEWGGIVQGADAVLHRGNPSGSGWAILPQLLVHQELLAPTAPLCRGHGTTRAAQFVTLTPALSHQGREGSGPAARRTSLFLWAIAAV